MSDRSGYYLKHKVWTNPIRNMKECSDFDNQSIHKQKIKYMQTILKTK